MDASMKDDYHRYWDMFYRGVLNRNERPLWDVKPELSVGLDWDVVEPLTENGFPILDIGCGLGDEAAWLAQRFHRVYAVDVSENAVEHARKVHKIPNLSFSVSDCTAECEGARLRSLFGPVNVYMRAVLHQVSDAHRLRGLQNLAALTRDSGATCVLTEVAPDIGVYFVKKSGSFSKIPKELQAAFISNLPPRGINISKFSALLEHVGASCSEIKETHLKTKICFPDGMPVEIPATRAIFHWK
jgi:SAM-dependent methyltransferase